MQLDNNVISWSGLPADGTRRPLLQAFDHHLSIMAFKSDILGSVSSKELFLAGDIDLKEFYECHKPPGMSGGPVSSRL